MVEVDDPHCLDGALMPSQNPRLFGHDAAQTFLATAYRCGRLHHAILIEGPEGVGKATLAFRFAYHLLTHPEPSSAPDTLHDPDLTRPEIRPVIQAASHDVLHIRRPVEAKTGRLKSAIIVDEIRRVGRFCHQTSGTGRYRIVILDTADSLNRSAANALLKILEEPSQQTVFLVLSHAPGQLLPTIRSRCLTLRLTSLDRADFARAVMALDLPVEHTDEQAMERLHEAARGSVSEAIRLLNYGGLEIMAALDGLFDEGKPLDRAALHRLVDEVTGRQREVAFDFLLNLVRRRLQTRALTAAKSGHLARAARLAESDHALESRIGDALVYNLDRKQLVLDIVSELAAQ